MIKSTVMKSFQNPLIIILFAASVLFSCEKTINPELEYADPILVVDAWLNDKVEPQEIRLTRTQPYLENELPTGVSGATVTVRYDGGEIIFDEDPDKPGTYRWIPTTGTSEDVFGTTGRAYTLMVTADGDTYEATSKINRTTTIDSISFKFEENSAFYPDDSYTAEFWANDPAGPGDTYWIKAYKNGVLLSKPSEISIAYDAAFTAGGNFDGVTFIPPIRAVNPDDVDEDDLPLSPYDLGDSLYVEIYSTTLEAYTFLNEVIIQTDRPGGFAELFSTPLANVSTNITNTDPNGKKAVGFFNVSAVNGKGAKLVE